MALGGSLELSRDLFGRVGEAIADPANGFDIGARRTELFT